MNRLLSWINIFIRKRRALRRWQRIVTIMAAIMTFATTYALILPAITVERDSTAEVGGMYLEGEADQDELFMEDAFEPTEAEIFSDNADEEETAPEVNTLMASGSDYAVTLTYDETYGVPDESVLIVSEIPQDSVEYQTYLEETKKAMGLTEEETLPSYAARFFDIKIMVDEQEFTPESGVSVEITYTEPLADHPDTEVGAVHFADETAEAEVIEANTADVQDDGTATVEFTAESFSVYGVIYTVDFHWEVDGKDYEFSIPGGGFVSFYDLVDVLGIVEDDTNTEKDEIRELVDGTAMIEFSNPELVSVSKVENDTTIGSVKESLELVCEYSAELTEEQIEEINAQTVSAGDWVLIALKPFDTQESLTVTMKNGDKWTMMVTDANVEQGSTFVSDIVDEKLFYIYMRYAGDSNGHNGRGDYYLKYDGTASQGLEYATRDSESGLADALGNDYLWRLIWNEDAYEWSIQNVGHPDYYMTLGYFDVTSTYDTMINIDAVTVDQNPNYDLPIWHPDTESIPYSSLESQNSYLGFHFYTDDSYYLGFDNDSRTFSTVRNRNYRIRVVSVPSKQPVITYTQDEIANGNVSSSNGSATDSGHLTISNDTTSTGLSRNVITAQPKAGYSFIGWEVVSGSVVSWGTTGSISENSVTIQPTVTEDTVLRAKFGINPLINVTQNDIDFGSVKYNNGAEDVTSNSQDQEITLSTRGPLANDEYQALYNITAVPEEGYQFVKWEISGDGDLVSWGADSTVTENSEQIRPYITGGDVTLTAVFEKKPDPHGNLDPNSAAAQLVAELQEELKKTSANVKKTAHVIDEEERTYEVKLSASSERKVIGPKMTLSFITDISRSMYFPANLTPVEGGVRASNLSTWLTQHETDDQGNPMVYYVITDINDTATMAALYKGTDGNWYSLDASYYYTQTEVTNRRRIVSVNSSNQLNLGGNNRALNDTYKVGDPDTTNDNRGNIRIYTAFSTSEANPVTHETTTNFTRLDYLKKAVGIIVDVVYEVDPAAEIGLVTFAKGTKGHFNKSSADAEYTTDIYDISERDDLKRDIGKITGTGGTNQKLGLQETLDQNWYGPEEGHPQVAILITDGAPQSTGDSEPWEEIGKKAHDLMDKGVELYTLGLSLDKVGDNKDSLYDVSGYKEGESYLTADKYKHNAENGEETIDELMSILRSLEVVGNLLGTVSDTVDEAFYPINEETGQPVQEGVYKADGTYLGPVSKYLKADNTPRHMVDGAESPIYDAKNETPYYTWTQTGGKWTITWYNQLVKKLQDGGSAGWNESFRVKAKEDFLGGNAINTNSGLATLSADRFKQEGYPDYIGDFDEPVTASAVTPRVNVAELGFDNRSTEWTVYLNTDVNPKAEIEKLYDMIMVQERVTKENADHQIASDGVSCLPGETSETYAFKTLPKLTQEEWGNVLAGHPIEKDYSVYGHRDVGTLRVEVINDGLSTIGTLNGTHHATPVGENSEKYTLRVTYTPEPADPTTQWNTTTGEEPGRPAEPIVSENNHTINVYALPLRIEKKDDFDEPVDGAVFSIFRRAKEGEEGESIEKYDSTLTGDYYCVNTVKSSDGVAVFAQPPEGQGSQNALVPGEEYYLIETEAPRFHKRDTTVYKVTVHATEGIYSNLAGDVINAQTCPFNWNQGAEIKINGETATIVDQTGAEKTLTGANGQPRSYVFVSDNCTFMKSIINTRSTDIQIKKVASDGTGVPRGLEGAVFQLRIKKNGVENLVSDIDGVSDELTIHINGENKTFNSAFLTTEEALTLAGLPDGTYVLEEVYTPPGFVKMVGTIEFSVSLGQMTMITDYQNNEYIDFTRANLSISNPSLAILTVTNVPGAALPNTGGPGTAILYVLGIILTGAAGAVLIIKRRVRAA